MRIPTYGGPQVSAQALPTNGFTPGDTAQIGGIAARQVEQLGNAEQQLGGVGMQIAAHAQQQANQLRVIDASNQAKEQMFNLLYNKDTGALNLRGNAALERPDGVSLPDEFGQKFKEHTDKIAESLGNDAQRLQFQRNAQAMHTQLFGTLSQHVSQEFTRYQSSVYDGTVATAQREIALAGAMGNFEPDPVTGKNAVDGASARIEAAVREKARLVGLSQTQADVEVRKQLSNGHAMAVLGALESGKPDYAATYLKKYREAMDADDILRVQGRVDKEVANQLGAGVAADVLRRNQIGIAPSDFDRLTNITLATESGGKRYGADGKLLESPKGAKGEMQVLDSTNTDPGYGVTPARDNSPEERARVGRDYLGVLLKKYDGNPALMWAAYNGGPGRLDEAIKKAEMSAKLNKTDPSVPVKTALDFMPQETRDYVAKNMKKLDEGQGTPQRLSMLDLDQQLMSDPRLAGNSRALSVARSEATRLFNEQNAAIKMQQEQALADVYDTLNKNGGSFAALSPAQRNAIPPKDMDAVMTHASKIAAGVPTNTDWGLYYQLKTDPAVLAGVNLGALRPKLAESEFKALVNEQQDLRSGKASSSTQLRSTHEVLAGMMREVGIDPTPKDNDKSGAEKAGKLWNLIETRIRDQESVVGHKLNQEEVKKEAAKVFTNVEVFRSIIPNASRLPSEVTAADRVVVPAGERAKIVAVLQSRGRPTDEITVANVYRRSLGIPDFKAN